MRMPRQYKADVDIFLYPSESCHCSRYYWPASHRGYPSSNQASTCGIFGGLSGNGSGGTTTVSPCTILPSP